MEIIYALLCGSYFAHLQFSYFFILEANLSSSGLTYLATTCSWVFGMVLALSLPLPNSLWVKRGLTFVSAVTFYLLAFTVESRPFDQSYLVFYMALIALSGVYSGYFFRASQKQFAEIRSLFFWENNGFILGLLSSYSGIAFIGRDFLYVVPAGLCLTVMALDWELDRREKLEESYGEIAAKFAETK